MLWNLSTTDWYLQDSLFFLIAFHYLTDFRNIVLQIIFPTLTQPAVEQEKRQLFLGPILGQYYLDRHSISNTNILTITGSVKYCPIFYEVECGYLTGLWNCFFCHVATVAWWVQSPGGSSLACEATMTAYHYCLGGSTWSVATWNMFLFVCQWSPMYPGRLVVSCLDFLVKYRS